MTTLSPESVISVTEIIKMINCLNRMKVILKWIFHVVLNKQENSSLSFLKLLMSSSGLKFVSLIYGFSHSTTLFFELTARGIGSSLHSSLVDAKGGKEGLAVLVSRFVPLSCKSHFVSWDSELICEKKSRTTRVYISSREIVNRIKEIIIYSE